MNQLRDSNSQVCWVNKSETHYYARIVICNTMSKTGHEMPDSHDSHQRSAKMSDDLKMKRLQEIKKRSNDVRLGKMAFFHYLERVETMRTFWEEKLEPVPENTEVKSNKVKERREKPGFSLKGVKTLKKRRSADCSDISSQKNLNDSNAEKVNKLNKENAKKSSPVIIAQQNILKADKPSRDVLEHNENKKGLAKTQTLTEKLHVGLEGDALEYEKSTKKVNDASISDISSNSHASTDDTQEDQGKIKASKVASDVNIQIEDESCQSAAKELDITVEEEDAEAEEDEAEEEEDAVTESDNESTPEEDSEEKERSSEETTEDDDTEAKQNENSVVHVTESSSENVPAPGSECQNVTYEVLHRKGSLKMWKDENENRESHFKSPTESQRSNLENDIQSSLNDQNSNSKHQVTEEELKKEGTKESQDETNNNQVVKTDEKGDLPTVIAHSSPLPAPFDHRIVSTKSTQIVHQYHINRKELLGGGRFGEVHKCTEKGTGLKFAAKTIKARGTKEKEEVKNEINVMNQLNHVNLLQLYDAYESKNDITLILELVEGGELFDRILDKQYNLSELDTIHFIKQICEGIQHMHQMYILHLDLKPENILCVNRATNQIKIIDFGLARPYKPREKLKVNFGTPEFLAPEVVNYEFVSFPTDMWSVGVIAYMLLSGLSPFLGDDDNETLNNIIACKWDFEDEEFQHVSEDAKDFITKLLVKGKSWRISATESLKHRWITDGKLHSRLKQQWKNMSCSMSKAPNDDKK
ncbi:myosin light chain kinase family member 4 [Protopterus annectens]|uniref:myosin light chain kinase family member 4 n=1 Tax=Protopterus annectens TaxID=7888 RepID=UPI001CFA3AFB|nr:myosin light chain kinase family member 4 [Protopterus annectens]